MLYEKDNVELKSISKDLFLKENEDIPMHETPLELNDAQKERLVKEIKAELEAIERERQNDDDEDCGNLEDRWKAQKDQYYSKLYTDSIDEFYEVSSGLTKDKCDKLTNRIYRAITTTDPIFAVSIRPDYSDNPESDAVAQDQADMLDYSIDERIPFKTILKRTIRSAVMHDVGWMAWDVCLKKRKVKRQLKIKGSPLWTIITGDGARIMFDDYDQFISERNRMVNEGFVFEVQYENEPLEDFIKQYGDAVTESLIDKLYVGKEIYIDVQHDEVDRDDPVPRFVEIDNLYVRKSVDGYEGLAETMLIGEKREYSYFDLKKLEKKGYMYDVDRLTYENDDKEKVGVQKKDYSSEMYELFQITLNTGCLDEEGDEDGDLTKVLLWYSRERKIIVGSQYYDDQYENVPCQYVPFYIKNVRNGIYQEGLADDVVNEDVSITMLLRFIFEAWYATNTVTPITEDQGIINDFVNGRWTHGMPLSADPKKLDFMHNRMQNIDMNGGLALQATLQKIAENKTGLTSGMSGGADPVDPNAPATKTLALLSESKPDLIAYIETMAPSINICGYIILAIYSQLADEPIPFRVGSDRVVKGQSPFKKISKERLKAKTNLQTQALAYAVDELQLKRELIAFYSLIRQEPVFARNPVAVVKLLRAIGKAWNSQIRNQIDQILPTIEELNMQQAEVAMQGVAKYVQAEMAKSQATGQAISFNPELLFQTIQTKIKQLVTPLSDEEQKQEERYVETVATTPSSQ